MSFHYLIIEVYGVLCDGWVCLLKARGLSFVDLLHSIYSFYLGEEMRSVAVMRLGYSREI